jgi:hypothetical protein
MTINSTYEIKTDDKNQEYIQCKMCQMRSYHPMDIKHKYCPLCKAFHQQPPRVESIPDSSSTPTTLTTDQGNTDEAFLHTTKRIDSNLGELQ